MTTGAIALADAERRLTAYLVALWRRSPPLRPWPAEAGAEARPGFDEAVIRLPATLPEIAAYRAALAHIAAHRAFSPRRSAQGLKPLLVAVVSLVEDARVEHLAMRRFPGLRRLWAPFHTAESSPSLIAADLLERLARALFDPDHRDANPWVQTGQALFFAQRDRWDDPDFSLTLGARLAGDLAKTRVQFNTKGHRVDPPYRDDNGGLWRYPDPPQDAQAPDTPLDAARVERIERADSPRRDGPPLPSPDHAPPSGAEPDSATGTPVAQYPEWDHRIGRHRPGFARIVEVAAAPAPLAALPVDEAGLVRRVGALVRAARIGQPERLRRQRDGDGLDLDACIAARAAQRARHTPDPRLYTATHRAPRDVAVLVLLDHSHSTNDGVGDSASTLLDLEKRAVDLLAGVLTEVGDRFALDAFCSNGRAEVRYQRLKPFDTPYDTAARQRLAGLEGRFSTRLGAALRHAGTRLAAQPALRRLLLVVTDGEPSDIDVFDRRHLVEDARKAVAELAGRRIDVVCVALGGDDPAADRPMAHIFGRRNLVPIDRAERLPQALPALYLRLTR